MKIGLDFDRVLFKTDEFKEYFFNKAGLERVDKEKVNENGIYRPELHARASGTDFKKVEKIYQEDLSDFLYSDVDMLDRISGHQLIIVSRGDESHQMRKIEATGIKEKVDEVVIVQQRPKDSVGIDVLFDDRGYEIDDVEIPAFRIDRPEDGIDAIIKEVERLEAREDI